MKRKIIVTIALILSLGLIGLMSSGSNVQAQRNRGYVYDSGVVHPGPNQMLIGLLVPSSLAQNENIEFQVTKMQYAQVSCNGSLCKDQIVSQTNFSDIFVSSFVVRDSILSSPTSSGVRIVFQSNNPNLRVSWQIIDTVSGAVVPTFSWGVSPAN